MDISINRGLMLDLAKAYRVHTDADQECFRGLWDLHRWSQDFRKDLEDATSSEVNSAFKYLQQVVSGVQQDRYGFQHVRRLKPGRYVIFSDHHMAYSGHRQDFFRKNVGLYRQVLKRYFDAGFTLVHNGDFLEL